MPQEIEEEIDTANQMMTTPQSVGWWYRRVGVPAGGGTGGWGVVLAGGAELVPLAKPRLRQEAVELLRRALEQKRPTGG